MSGFDDDDLKERYATRESGRIDPVQAIEMLGRRLGGAIVVAGAMIGLALYAGGGEDEGAKFQAFAADGEVFRVNTESGRIIACNAQRCTTILERGQDLAEDQGNTLFRSPPSAQLPAPAPVLQPSAPAAPAPQLPAPAAQGR